MASPFFYILNAATMNEYQKMMAGLDFNGADPALNAKRDHAHQVQTAVNQSDDLGEVQRQLNDLLQLGEGCFIKPPIQFEFGCNIRMGDRCFINLGCTFLDGGQITLGHHVMVGPHCQFYSAGHDLDYRKRRNWETICNPITVEDDVWIGGNVVITQGVTIGKGAVVAANSLVNKDVPAHTLVGGTPAKVIRKLDLD